MPRKMKTISRLSATQAAELIGNVYQSRHSTRRDHFYRVTHIEQRRAYLQRCTPTGAWTPQAGRGSDASVDLLAIEHSHVLIGRVDHGGFKAVREPLVDTGAKAQKASELVVTEGQVWQHRGNPTRLERVLAVAERDALLGPCDARGAVTPGLTLHRRVRWVSLASLRHQTIYRLTRIEVGASKRDR